MIHGGDSFAVIVEYLPTGEEPRYIWQRDHVWMHLTYSADEFLPPQLLPAGAPANAPITAPEAGGAVDYLNVFHVSVAHWPDSGRAVVSNVDHPVMRGLGLKLGDPVPGRWAGEADMIYEPAAWDILVRSVEATTEPGEDFQERVKQPPFHRAGLSLHKNLRLAVVSGENFTGILADPANTLFRSLYARIVHYLLDTAPCRVKARRPLSKKMVRNSSSRRAEPSGQSATACRSSSTSRTRSGFANRRLMRIMSSKDRRTGKPGRFWLTAPTDRGGDCRPTDFRRRFSPECGCEARFPTGSRSAWRTCACFAASEPPCSSSLARHRTWILRRSSAYWSPSRFCRSGYQSGPRDRCGARLASRYPER